MCGKTQKCFCRKIFSGRRVATCKPGKPGLTSFSETLALFFIQFLSFRKMKVQDRQNGPSGLPEKTGWLCACLGLPQVYSLHTYSLTYLLACLLACLLAFLLAACSARLPLARLLTCSLAFCLLTYSLTHPLPVTN